MEEKPKGRRQSDDGDRRMTPPGHKTRQRIGTVGFMMGLTALSITVVAGLHGVTAERVKRNAGLHAYRAVLAAAGIDAPRAPEALADLFHSLAIAANQELAPGEIADRYQVRHPGDDRELQVLRIRGTGLWGSIEAMVGVDPSDRSLTGIAFLDHNETPGLGARIEDSWFRNQFAGKRRGEDDSPIVYREEDADDVGPQAFNGITGATTTTRAVAGIVNRALAEL